MYINLVEVKFSRQVQEWREKPHSRSLTSKYNKFICDLEDGIQYPGKTKKIGYDFPNYFIYKLNSKFSAFYYFSSDPVKIVNEAHLIYIASHKELEESIPLYFKRLEKNNGKKKSYFPKSRKAIAKILAAGQNTNFIVSILQLLKSHWPEISGIILGIFIS